MPSISAAGWKSAYDCPVTQGAEYFDGRTAARHNVVLRFDLAALHITGDDIAEVWDYADIRYAGENHDDLPQTFRRLAPAVDAARLRIGDQSTIDSLRIRCPDLEDRVRRDRRRKRGFLWASLGVVALGLVIWSTIQFLPRVIAPLLPVAWEEALGDGVVDDMADIFATMTDGKVKRCETADGRLALDILMGQLARQVKTPYSFQVIVLDIDIVNALAAPGGRIVVFKKLLTDATSPDEVAGVLAHEMGHAIARHPTQAVARSMGMSLVFNVLMGGLGSGAAGAAGQALVNSAYSRDAERDADSIALDILGGAQISPKGFAAFFERMARDEGGAARAMSFISSHPPSDERAEAARAATAANTHPALSAREWAALRSICD